MSWPLVKLSDCCEITMGQAPVGSSYNEKGEGYALIAGAGDFGELTPKPKKHTTAASKLSKKEDLILCIRATIGDLNWSNEEYCLGRGVAGLRPKAILDKNYLWYFIKANKEQLASKGTGSTFKQVSRVIISDWEIPLPPLDEQKRIAAILDKADAIHRKRQQAIKLADDFLRSVFLDMFGDPVTNPKNWDVGHFSEISTLNPKAEKYDDEFLVSFVPMPSVSTKSHMLDASDIRAYSDVKKGFTAFKENDVLFAKITPCMENGKAAIATQLENGIGFGSTEFHVFRPQNMDYAPFIYSLVHLPLFRKIAANNFSGAVGHKRVPKDFLSSFKLILPPEHLVIKFQTIFETVNENKSKFESNVENGEQLFNSLSQKAFAGKL